MSDPFALLGATWPAARTWRSGPLTLRDGAGGGKRASAATCDGPLPEGPLPPLFMIRRGEDDLDTALGDRGYRRLDPTLILEAPRARIADGEVPPVSGFAAWPPLHIQREVWAEGGIGAGRIACMARVRGRKAALLGRVRDQVAGTAFVAEHVDGVMVHALHVRDALRRAGMAAVLMRHAARWSGAATIAVAVKKDNAAARALYDRLGFRLVASYHYRQREAAA